MLGLWGRLTLEASHLLHSSSTSQRLDDSTDNAPGLLAIVPLAPFLQVPSPVSRAPFVDKLCDSSSGLAKVNMSSFLRSKQSGVQHDLSASIRPELFTPDDQARYGINSQIRYG